jgi:adenylate cyclase
MQVGITDIRMAFFSPTFPSRDKIVIVGISEEELSKYPYRSPVSRQLLADLLSQTASKGAKAIGIDFLFDQPTDPDKDSQLSNAIRQVRIPLVASYSSTLTGVQKTYVDNFVPASDLGNVDILVDPVAGAVRWTYPKVRLQDGKESFSFAGLLAHKTGVNVPSGKVAIMWNSNEPAFPQIPVDLVRFLPPNFLRSKIVLIGLMTSDHAHVTPLSVMGGGPRMPDVEVQAEALATLEVASFV